jgi:hypothetical protein
VTIFEPKEAEKLKSLLQNHPNGAVAGKAITQLMNLQDLSNNLKYPINSFSDLEKQLGPDKMIKIESKETKLSDLKSKIPVNQFPIVSNEDFFAKASALMKIKEGSINKPWGIEITTKGPPLPKALLQMKPPEQMSSDRVSGLTADQLKKLLSDEDFQEVTNSLQLNHSLQLNAPKEE